MSPKKQAEEIIVKPNIPLDPIASVRRSSDALNIARSLSEGLLTHAALIMGDELLCRDIFLSACGVLSEKSGITNLENPDILTLRGDKLTVENTEDVLETISAPPHTARRMIYISGAGRMSEYVQNKLLKTLEEPPPDNQFVLSGPDGLLPTVLSRCMPIIVPDSLHNTYEKRAAILTESVKRDTGLDIPPSVAADCLEYSGNVLDTAYRLASDTDMYDLHTAAFDWFVRKNPKYLFEIPAEFVRSREESELVLGLFSRCISDMMLIIKEVRTAFFTGERESALRLMAKKYDLRELTESFDLCIESIERLFSNAPAKQTFDNLYARAAILNRMQY